MKALLCFLYTMFFSLTSTPYLTFRHSYLPSHSSAFPPDTCKQMKVTSNYVFRLGANNLITSCVEWDLVNFSHQGVDAELRDRITINSFDVDQNQTSLILTQNESTKFANLMDFTLQQEWKQSFYKIIYGKHVLAMEHTLSSDVFYRFKYKKQPKNMGLSLVGQPRPLLNLKNSKCSPSPNNTYFSLLGRIQQCLHLRLLKFSSPSFAQSQNHEQNLLLPNLTQAIQFSADGQYFILEADDQISLSLISLNDSSFLAKRSAPSKGIINKAMFLDSNNNFIITFNDSGYTLIQTSTMKIAYSRSLVLATSIIEIDYSSNEIYVCKDQKVEVYQASHYQGNCSDNCSACASSSFCFVCAQHYQLINESCFEIASNLSGPQAQKQPPQDQNLDIQIDIVNATNDWYNSSDASALDQTSLASNDTLFYYIMPDGTILAYQITYGEALTINKTAQALGHANKVLQKLMIFLSSTPFLFLILGNLQFFTATSIYIFLSSPYPQSIQQILQSTFNALNANLLAVLGLEIDVPGGGRQRVVDSKYADLGVSTLFLPSNYQYIILSIGVIASMVLAKCLLASLGCKRLPNFLRQNQYKTVVGILISGLPQWVLPFTYVYSSLSLESSNDKINFSVQILVIGSAFLMAPIYVSAVSGRCLRKKESILIKQKDNIYYIAVNILFPGLAMVSQPIYFLAINLLLLLAGLYLATKSSEQRLNQVCLSIYPILFHSCFILFHFTTNIQLIVITQIACLLIYFLGTTHQFLTILVGLIRFIYQTLTNKHQIVPAPKHLRIKREKENVGHNKLKFQGEREAGLAQVKSVTIAFVKSDGQFEKVSLKGARCRRYARGLQAKRGQKCEDKGEVGEGAADKEE